MSGFKFTELKFNGAYLIENFYTGDNRGGFTKCFEKSVYNKVGINFCLNETFVSVSGENVVRGLHFQLDKPQAKIISVLQGGVWDVIVDLRPSSDTYKQWMGIDINAENHRAVYIPRGFAHGFISKTNGTIMLYQCDGQYDKETDTGIKYDEAEFNIEWPIDPRRAIRSARDLNLMSFKEYQKNPMKLE